MKTTILERNGVSPEMVGLISRLVEMIPWPERRCAMGDVTLLLLNGKHRAAENAFGWSRSAVEMGINEFQLGISCVNDISTRIKPKSEEKIPNLLVEIHAILQQYQDTNAGHTNNMTARAVYESLVKKGWATEALPTIRTISNILTRHDFNMPNAAKAKPHKKPPKRPSPLATSNI